MTDDEHVGLYGCVLSTYRINQALKLLAQFKAKSSSDIMSVGRLRLIVLNVVRKQYRLDSTIFTFLTKHERFYLWLSLLASKQNQARLTDLIPDLNLDEEEAFYLLKYFNL